MALFLGDLLKLILKILNLNIKIIALLIRDLEEGLIIVLALDDGKIILSRSITAHDERLLAGILVHMALAGVDPAI